MSVSPSTGTPTPPRPVPKPAAAGISNTSMQQRLLVSVLTSAIAAVIVLSLDKFSHNPTSHSHYSLLIAFLSGPLVFASIALAAASENCTHKANDRARRAATAEVPTIRLARDADVDQIVSVVNKAYDISEGQWMNAQRTNPKDVRNMMEEGIFIVATYPSTGVDENGEAKETIAGSAFVKPVDNENEQEDGDSKRGYIGMLAVDEAYQGRSLARLIFEEAEKQCLLAGSSFLDLTVLNLRHDLYAFYRKLGFSPCGTKVFPVPGKILVPMHLIKFTKAIKQFADL